jgi:large subunit ribosomal protein L32
MPLPKRKTSHKRTTQRRAANWKLPLPEVIPCPRCHAPRLAHNVCPSCGFYKNRMVIDVRARRGDEGAPTADAAAE